MKILVTNAVTLNAGVAAMVLAMREMFLREFGEDTEVIVFDDRGAAAAKYYPELDFRCSFYMSTLRGNRVPLLGGVITAANRARFLAGVRALGAGRRALARLLLTRGEREDLAHYETADVVVSVGGTYLVESYVLDHRFFEFGIALALGRPLVLFSQSMGPFRDPGNRRRLAPILEAARLVCLRDERSLAHVRDLGVRSPHVELCGDAVFALVPEERPPQARPPERPLRVAVSVRRWPGFKTTTEAEGMRRYREAFAEAVTRLVRERSAEVVFVSTCQGIPEYWFDDSEVAAEILQMLPFDVRGKVGLDASFRPPQAMIEHLRGFDLVIATRFHAAVFAMMADVPTVAISYEFQTRELYERLALPEWVQDIETIESGAFCARLEHCIGALATVRSGLRAGIARERDLAWRAAHLLRERLDADAPRRAGSAQPARGARREGRTEPTVSPGAGRA